MKTFIWHNGRPQSMKNYNDDLITSCAIGCWVKDIAFSINQREVEYKKAFVDSMGISRSSLNTAIPGMKGHKKIKDKEEIKKNKEFIWLLKG